MKRDVCQNRMVTVWETTPEPQDVHSFLVRLENSCSIPACPKTVSSRCSIATLWRDTVCMCTSEGLQKQAPATPRQRPPDTTTRGRSTFPHCEATASKQHIILPVSQLVALVNWISQPRRDVRRHVNAGRPLAPMTASWVSSWKRHLRRFFDAQRTWKQASPAQRRPDELQREHNNA